MKINRYILSKKYNINKYEIDSYASEVLDDIISWRYLDSYINNGQYLELTLDEILILSELSMMYNSRYDQVIRTDYDKSIKGYKSWTDLYKRTKLYFNISEIDIDKKSILLNLINKLIIRLLDLKLSIKSGEYISIPRALSISLVLYEMKRYNKYDIYSLLNKINNIELERLYYVLRSSNRWTLGFISRILRGDLPGRLYSRYTEGINEIDHFTEIPILVPENDEDLKLLAKWNTK